MTPEQLREKLGRLYEDEVLACVRGFDLMAKLYQDERERLAESYLWAIAMAHLNRDVCPGCGRVG